jgi:cob(I)alamin adenosyltransferase
MKIYTKTGDKGTTALVGGKRVAKNHNRIEAYGTADELISYLGLLRDHEIGAEYKDFFTPHTRRVNGSFSHFSSRK